MRGSEGGGRERRGWGKGGGEEKGEEEEEEEEEVRCAKLKRVPACRKRRERNCATGLLSFARPHPQAQAGCCEIVELC